MVPDDEAVAERPPRLTHVIYNATLGHVRVRSEDAPATTVEVPPGEVRFRRVVGATEPQAALWLDSAECAALARLLDYALSALRIAPAYQAPLAALQAKVAELAALTTVASPADETAPAPDPFVLPAEPAPAATEPLAGARGGSRRAGRRAGRAPAKTAVTAEPSSVAPVLAAEMEEATSAALNGASPVSAPAPVPDAAPAAAAGAPPRAFHDVWRDLRLLGERHPRLHALAGQVTSEVREVADEGIWVYSHGIGRTYCVPREQLEAAWNALTAAGRLVARDLGLGQGAVTLLAHLPYVEYSAQPLTLHYPAQTPHELGTIQRRDVAP
jgi:hypothetical protein